MTIKTALSDPLINWLRKLFRGTSSDSRSIEQVFTRIYEKNAWNSEESISGAGSEMEATENIRSAIPHLIADRGIKTMVDIPCGDFHWMKKSNLSGIQYSGFDIVLPLIVQNAQKYQTQALVFEQKNLLTDDLGKVDLILNRECLIHLSYHDIFMALENIKRSDSTFLLTTTFPDWKLNQDISTGSWRPLNLEIPPFNFPAPIELIIENYKDVKLKRYGRKCMGLWYIKDLLFKDFGH